MGWFIEIKRWAQRFSSKSRHPQRSTFSFLRVEEFEPRITPTGNIAITNALVVDQNNNSLSVVNPGQWVYLQADFTTQNLPSNASYRVAFTVNGLTLDSSYITWGAGSSGTGSWDLYWGTFIATPGVNQVTTIVDPDHSVAETSYADNSMSITFNATGPAVGSLTYTPAQMREAYGINNIPNFGSATADGTGQTIALVELGNDPTILADLDGYDQAMSLTPTSTQTLYQLYGPASSILSVYNQNGVNITANIGTSGTNGVPPLDSNQGEVVMDVEWAHALAPGAHIDIVAVDPNSNWLNGDIVAASLPDVSTISNSWGSSWNYSGETANDSDFVTPSGHTGVTFLTASNDNGANVYGGNMDHIGYYPAVAPNMVSVGGTQLNVNSDGYGSETGWSFPTPTNTINYGGSSYSQTGTWSSHTGGFSGTYGTAAAGSSSTATSTIAVTPTNTGWGTELSATWTPSPGNATNATYTIYDGNSSSGTLLGTVVINQALAPVGTADGSSQFQELGVFFPTLSSSGDGTLTVVLHAQSANGTVVDDAIGAAPAWASTGGPDQFETEPAYQLPFQSTGHRTTPDVSFDASFNATVYQGGLNYDYGGTSLGSPCWAALIAIANQGRVAEGASTLNSPANPQQTLQALYSLPASDYHDIITGYNGFSAGPGYDFVTGRGTPIANILIPDLVSYGLTPTVTGLNANQGLLAGGTTVTISGHNFLGATSVHFGSVAATSFTIVSSTQISAVSPSESAGTINVTVTTVGGTSATSTSDQFTYFATPTVTGLSPNTGPATGGTSVVITGTGFTSAATVEFGPIPATSITFNSATSLTAVDPAGTEIVPVTVTTPGGPSALTSSDLFTYTTTFQVTSTTLLPGDNGFLVTFGAPYNISDLSLYTGDSGHVLTTRSVQITGPNGAAFGGASADTLRFNAVPITSTQLEFILTGLDHVAVAPVLPAGAYTLTLDGGSSDPAFRRLSDGAYMDGNVDGTIEAVDNYTTTVSVSAIPASTDVVTIGDLVAGPGQTVSVPLVLGGGAGSVSQTTAVNLTMASPANGAYSITGFNVNSTLSAVNVSFDPTTGVLSLSRSTPFSTTDSPLLLGTFTVAVAGLGNGGTAPGIDTKTPITMNVTNVMDGSSPKPFVVVDGFHLSAYLGNLVAPVGIYNSSDVSQLQGIIVTSVKALALYPNVDPYLLADVNRDGSVNNIDVSQLQARILGTTSVIPALPAGASGLAVNGADPVLFVGTTFTNGQPANLGSLAPGSTVLVPLSVFITDPHGVNVTAVEAAFSFDSKVFTLNGVIPGAIANGSLAGSPFAVAFAEVGPGEVNVIGSSSDGPTLAYGRTATLFLVSLTVRADAPVGGTVFNLMSSEAGLQTALQDNLGRNLVLAPAPDNRAGDNVDGAFTVQSGQPVLASGPAGTVATVDRKQGVSVTVLTPAAWEELTTRVFEYAANPSVMNGSNNGMAVPGAGSFIVPVESRKQAGFVTARQPVAWELLTTRLFEDADQQADGNNNFPILLPRL